MVVNRKLKIRRIVFSRKRTLMFPDFDKHKYLLQSWKFSSLTGQHYWMLSSRVLLTIKGSIMNWNVSLKPVVSDSTLKQQCSTMASSCFSMELCHAHIWEESEKWGNFQCDTNREWDHLLTVHCMLELDHTQVLLILLSPSGPPRLMSIGIIMGLRSLWSLKYFQEVEIK